MPGIAGIYRGWPGGSREEFVLQLYLSRRYGYVPPADAESERRGVDWRKLFRIADQQGVLPLVAAELRADPAREGIPHAVLNQLCAATVEVAAGNLTAADELVTITGALEDVGIPVISFKGPELALRAHGDLGARQFNDLDILVRERQLDAAEAVLLGLGYHRKTGGLSRSALSRSDHHWQFRAPGRMLVELHWRFSQALFASGVDRLDVWSTCEVTRLRGCSVRTLTPVAEFMVLAMHGSAEGWSHLIWLCDLAALMRTYGDMDWELLVAESRRVRVHRPLLLGFALTERVLAVTLPDPVVRAIRADRDIGALTDLAVRHVRDRDGGNYAYARLHLRLQDGIAARLRFLAAALFLPNSSDTRSLPGQRAPLYYVTRPLRLALKYRPRGSLKSAARANFPP